MSHGPEVNMSDTANVMGPTPDEQLWKAADVARYLQCSRAWVYREASAGRLPVVDFLGLRRFDPAAIRALKEKLTRKTGRVIVPVRP